MKVAYLKSKYRNVDDKVERIFQLLDYSPVKNSILIKPNLVFSFVPRLAITTSPCVVEAIVKYFRKNYPEKKILIGDGPAAKIDFNEILMKCGYLYLKDKYGVDFIDLNYAPKKKYQWKFGYLKLPELLETHEYINVPKLKTHSQTTVSICSKNQKGLLDIPTKKAFHKEEELSERISLLGEIIKPDLNIVDGIHSIEGSGPVWHGRVRKSNFLAASKSLLAADNFCLKMMGLNVDEIDHIAKYENYSVHGDEVCIPARPFLKPQIPVKDLNSYTYGNDTVCSQCFHKVYEALHPKTRNYKILLKHVITGSIFKKFHFVFGKYDGIINEKNVICLGDCAEACAKKHSYDFVRGCPPSIEEIREVFFNLKK